MGVRKRSSSLRVLRSLSPVGGSCLWFRHCPSDVSVMESSIRLLGSQRRRTESSSRICGHMRDTWLGCLEHERQVQDKLFWDWRSRSMLKCHTSWCAAIWHRLRDHVRLEMTYREVVAIGIRVC